MAQQMEVGNDTTLSHAVRRTSDPSVTLLPTTQTHTDHVNWILLQPEHVACEGALAAASKKPSKAHFFKAQ